MHSWCHVHIDNVTVCLTIDNYVAIKKRKFPIKSKRNTRSNGGSKLGRLKIQFSTLQRESILIIPFTAQAFVNSLWNLQWSTRIRVSLGLKTMIWGKTKALSALVATERILQFRVWLRWCATKNSAIIHCPTSLNEPILSGRLNSTTHLRALQSQSVTDNTNENLNWFV